MNKMVAALAAVFGVLILLLVYALQSRMEEKQEIEDSLSRALDQAEELHDAQWAANEDGDYSQLENSFAPDAEASGVALEMQKLMSDLLNDGVALANDYAAELEAVGWTTILEPSRLQADTSFAESRRLVEVGKATAEKYARLSREIVENSPQRIAKLNLPDDVRQGFETGYREGLAQSIGFVEKVWDLEVATVDEIGSIIDFLEANRPSWWVENGQLVFETQDLVDRYNAHFDRIDEILAQQQKMQKDRLDAQRRKVDAM